MRVERRCRDEVRRFAREFESTRTIDHPNVVRGLGFGQVEDGPYAGTHYMALELLHGEELCPEGLWAIRMVAELMQCQK